jgi:hypothetical protein
MSKHVGKQTFDVQTCRHNVQSHEPIKTYGVEGKPTYSLREQSFDSYQNN